MNPISGIFKRRSLPEQGAVIDKAAAENDAGAAEMDRCNESAIMDLKTIKGMTAPVVQGD